MSDADCSLRSDAAVKYSLLLAARRYEAAIKPEKATVRYEVPVFAIIISNMASILLRQHSDDDGRWLHARWQLSKMRRQL